ncbi:MAG: class I SAM-dependent DNA methyltransferase [Candidatus Hodarchaeota archaeon]
MNKLKDFQNLEKLFDFFDVAIQNNNSCEIKNCFKLIELSENSFLKSYHEIKKEGVYYTNKQISNFIFSEALILFLNKKLGENILIKIEDIFKLNSLLKNQIYEILINTTICDPSCGSGVFLLSAIDLVYNLLKKINPQLDSHIKTQILKNIYGFDINEYAIKLCLLKLFAWFYNKSNFNFSHTISILKSNLKVKNSLKTPILQNFDIIIGNPPYGNILTKFDKELLKKEEIYYNEIYCSFLLKALLWSKGVIGFLVPKSFLLRQGYTKFRNKLLSYANILKIFDIGPNLFKNATNEVQIVLFENKDHKIKNLRIYNYPKREIISYKNQNFDSLRMCFNSNCPLCAKSKKIFVYTFNKSCPYCGFNTTKLNRIRIKTTSQIYRLINKIEKCGNLNYLNIKDFPKMIRGEEDKGLKHVKKIVNKDTNGTCFFIGAKDDFSYYYIKKNKSFNIEEIDAKILKGENYEFYTSPKLLIKHNNIIPEALYTEDNVCFTSSIYSLLHDDIDELKCLCAYLNGVLIQFYCIYGINNQKGTTINLNQYMIRHLPIKRPDEDIKTEIIKRVDEIIKYLEINEGIANENVYQLYREIDDMIFTLYGITKDSRDIIVLNTKNQINHFKNIYSRYQIN